MTANSKYKGKTPNFLIKIFFLNAYKYNTDVIQIDDTDFMNLSKPMEIIRKDNESYSQQLKKVDISILALPLFVKDKALDTENPSHRHILNMNNVNMRLCSSAGVESIKHTIFSKSKDVLDAKYTLIPFKSPTPQSKKSHCSLIVSHSSIKKSTDDLNMDGINVIVKDEFAQPLSTTEMNKFMNHLRSCDIQFDKKKHKDYIIDLANKLLPKNKIDKFTKRVKDTDFYESYQYLRDEYQKEYPFRIGICDGAHRITAMFNVIYGIELRGNGLSLVSDRPDVQDLCNLDPKAGCEVWEYKNIRKSIKIKQNFKINQCLIFVNNLYRIF